MNIINISTSPGAFAWKPAAWLRVSGGDALSFLQGQFTNELRRLSLGEAAYGLWLTVKGKVLADSFVLRGAEGGADIYWVGSYHSPATVIRERLEAFVIADDVVIEDATDEWDGVTLWGSEGHGLAAAAARQGSGSVTGSFVFQSRRGSDVQASTSASASASANDASAGAAPAWEWVFPAAQREAAWTLLAGVPVLEAAEAERRRIAAGAPAVPADIGPGDLPNEAGLEATAISFTKGCYLGQEVMARLKSMGQVRRRLLRVRGTGPAPTTLPAALFAGERKLGELRSVAPDAAGGGFTGLALLSLLNLTPGAVLALAPDGAPGILVVDPLPSS